MNRPSATDFLAFKWLMFGCRTLDVAEVYGNTKRKLRREIEKSVGHPLCKRTDEEIATELMEMDENCRFVDVEAVLHGVPRGRWDKFRNKWIVQRPTSIHRPNSERPHYASPVEAIRQRHNPEFLPLGRWFSGKRYGVIIDEEVAEALQNSEIDTSQFDLALPWSPILVKLGDQEFFMYYENGKAVFLKFFVDQNGEVTHTGKPALIKDSKEAMASWIACISKGEAVGENFELKVGNCLVALLPRVNARTLIVKHKISAEAETDKGAWIRKGYFRTTKDGVAWIDGTVCRKELPFVHKVHEIKKKGQPVELPK